MHAIRMTIVTDARNGILATDTCKVWGESRMHAIYILVQATPLIVQNVKFKVSTIASREARIKQFGAKYAQMLFSSLFLFI